MIISTANYRTNLIFVFFVVILFSTLKSFVLDKIILKYPLPIVWIIVLCTALITGILLFVMDSYFTKKGEKRVTSSNCSINDKGYKLFLGFCIKSIVEIQGSKCNIYWNEFDLNSIELSNINSKLKARFMSLNKKDRLYICCYRFVYIISISIVLFIILYAVYINKMGYYINEQDGIIFIIIIILLIINILYRIIMRIKNLQFFTCE